VINLKINRVINLKINAEIKQTIVLLNKKSTRQKRIEGHCQGCDQGRNLIHNIEDTSVWWAIEL
jgi:hypothetical protein